MNHLNLVVRAAVAVGCLCWSVQGRAAPTESNGTNDPQVQAAASYTLHPTNSDRMALFWPTQKTIDMLCGTGDALQTFKIAIGHKGYIPRVPDEAQVKTEDDAEKYLADHKLPAAVFITVSLKSETNTAPARLETPAKSGTNATSGLAEINNTVSNAQTTVSNTVNTVKVVTGIIDNAKNFFGNLGKNQSTDNSASQSPAKEGAAAAGNESKEKPSVPAGAAPTKGPALPVKFNNIVTMSADIVNQDGDTLWTAVVTTTNADNPSQTDFTDALTAAARALAQTIPARTEQKQ